MMIDQELNVLLNKIEFWAMLICKRWISGIADAAALAYLYDKSYQGRSHLLEATPMPIANCQAR